MIGSRELVQAILELFPLKQSMAACRFKNGLFSSKPGSTRVGPMGTRTVVCRVFIGGFDPSGTRSHRPESALRSTHRAIDPPPPRLPLHQIADRPLPIHLAQEGVRRRSHGPRPVSDPPADRSFPSAALHHPRSIALFEDREEPSALRHDRLYLPNGPHQPPQPEREVDESGRGFAHDVRGRSESVGVRTFVRGKRGLRQNFH